MEMGKKKMKMEGLIPFLIRSMSKKKQRPNHDYSRFSQISSRSTGYQLLAGEGGESVNVNSSHRRTRSEFHPPASFDITEQATVIDSSSSVRKSFCPDSIPISYSSSSSNAVSSRQISSNSNY